MSSNIKPLVSIIIVNYNGKSYLQKCLSSIKKNNYDKYEIILVDNNSTDNSINFINDHFPNVKIIKLEKNYGFAGPNNIGAKQAKGDLLFFLNNDTTLTENAIFELVNHMQQSDASICQSLLLTLDESIDSSGDFFSLHGISYSSKEATNNTKPILSARGAAMMIRKQIFWELEGFDEKFFVSFEDIDLCWRAWILGYKVILVPNSIVYHYGSKTVSKLKATVKFHGTKNTIILCLSNFEFNYSMKSLFKLATLFINKKIFDSRTNTNLESLYTMPNFKTAMESLRWIIRNLFYVLQKRQKVNSKRVVSTDELIKRGLISEFL